MTDLNDLANRIETEAPSRKLFMLALEVVHGDLPDVSDVLQRFEELVTHEAWEQAALSLVPDGFGVDLSANYTESYAMVWTDDDASNCPTSFAPTLAQAITAAALRAIAGDKS